MRKKAQKKTGWNYALLVFLDAHMGMGRMQRGEARPRKIPAWKASVVDTFLSSVSSSIYD